MLLQHIIKSRDQSGKREIMEMIWVKLTEVARSLSNLGNGNIA